MCLYPQGLPPSAKMDRVMLSNMNRPMIKEQLILCRCPEEDDIEEKKYLDFARESAIYVKINW